MLKTIGKRRVYINIINIMESLCGNKRETICKDDCSSEYSLFIATLSPPTMQKTTLKRRSSNGSYIGLCNCSSVGVEASTAIGVDYMYV